MGNFMLVCIFLGEGKEGWEMGREEEIEFLLFI